MLTGPLGSSTVSFTGSRSGASAVTTREPGSKGSDTSKTDCSRPFTRTTSPGTGAPTLIVTRESAAPTRSTPPSLVRSVLLAALLASTSASLHSIHAVASALCHDRCEVEQGSDLGSSFGSAQTFTGRTSSLFRRAPCLRKECFRSRARFWVGSANQSARVPTKGGDQVARRTSAETTRGDGYLRPPG